MRIPDGRYPSGQGPGGGPSGGIPVGSRRAASGRAVPPLTARGHCPTALSPGGCGGGTGWDSGRGDTGLGDTRGGTPWNGTLQAGTHSTATPGLGHTRLGHTARRHTRDGTHQGWDTLGWDTLGWNTKEWDTPGWDILRLGHIGAGRHWGWHTAGRGGFCQNTAWIKGLQVEGDNLSSLRTWVPPLAMQALAELSGGTEMMRTTSRRKPSAVPPCVQASQGQTKDSITALLCPRPWVFLGAEICPGLQSKLRDFS